MGSALPWSGEAVVPHFVSDNELMVRGLFVVVGFMRSYDLPCFVVVAVARRRKSFSGADATLTGTGEWYRR